MRNADDMLAVAASRAEEPVGVHPSPLFVEHCAKCHGADGKAETPEGRERHAEVFNDPKWQESKRKKADKLIASVTNGHGKKMPAFKDKLTPEEIRGLVEKDVLGPWK